MYKFWLDPGWGKKSFKRHIRTIGEIIPYKSIILNFTELFISGVAMAHLKMWSEVKWSDSVVSDSLWPWGL